MTVTVLARSPISSPRPAPGISTSRSPPAILPNAPFRRVIGRATPRKENTTEAISDMTTTIAMIRLIWLARSVSAITSSLEIFASFLRTLDRRLHQVGDVSGGLDGAVGDDFALRLLGLDGLLIGGQEALDDRGQVADHDQQIPVIGLATQLVENILQRGLGLAHLRDQIGIAGGAELPGSRPQRVHLGIGLKQQTFDLEAVVQLRHGRRTHLGRRPPWSILPKRPSACRSAPAA